MSCFARFLLLMLMTIADLQLLPVSCCSLSYSSLISQRGIAFNKIPIEDSTLLYNNSIFSDFRYLSSGMSCTLRCCHCSRTFTPTTASSTDFAVEISRFDLEGINIIASAYSIKSAEIDSDGAYLTPLK